VGLSASTRRDGLLDVAADLLVEHGPAGVTMDAVAAAAGVSRPLVYKHFANRDDLLVELHRRESDRFEAAVRTAVTGVRGFEALVRATAGAVLNAPLHQARTFAALVRAEPASDTLRDATRKRSEGNRAFFARLAAAEFGLDEPTADAAVAVFFTGLDSLVGWSRSRRSALSRDALLDLYVALVLGGLREVASSTKR
jgi:AcrR family transcriptional regulator